LLALETATEACSAALWIDGSVLERFELAGQAHSRRLLPMVDELLAEAGLVLSQLEAIGFGRGPGGFTGVRIATGVAQGLALGAGLPVVPVSTLAALAQVGGEERVLAALDARMGQVYWACFVRAADGCMEAVSAEQVSDPRAVCPPSPAGWTGAGSGFDAYGEQLRVAAPGVATIHLGRFPRAAGIAPLAARACARGEGLDAASALPLYVRDDVARRPRD